MSAKPPPGTADASIAEPTSLRALRAELDRIDDAIHDLLIERSHVVSRVGSEGQKAHSPYRPGREAAILRRLLARHSGPLAPEAIVRIWRELVAAGSAVQGGHRLAVYDPDPSCGYVQLAREHFGALTPLRTYDSAAAVLDGLRTGAAGIGVLPAPGQVAPGAWWTALLGERWRTGAYREPRLHAVARLPFWSRRPEGAPRVSGLAVSRAQPDPSGRDRSLLGFALSSDVSQNKLLQDLVEAGLRPCGDVLRCAGSGPDGAALLEVDGFVTEIDPRLHSLDSASRAAVLGSYAVPVGGEAG